MVRMVEQKKDDLVAMFSTRIRGHSHRHSHSHGPWAIMWAIGHSLSFYKWTSRTGHGPVHRLAVHNTEYVVVCMCVCFCFGIGLLWKCETKCELCDMCLIEYNIR